jgi:hypothetical protein
MKKELSTQDLELICSAICPGAFTVEIQSQTGNKQMISGEFLADHNKPNSLLLVNYLNTSKQHFEHDFIIDFSGKMNLKEYNVLEFYLNFHEDESIQHLFEEQKKKRLWGLNLIFSRKKKFKIFFKKQLFFKKQMEHLPCDNYLIYFGNSKYERKLEIQLFSQKKHVIDFQIANDEQTAARIALQKHFMSKLSFCNFESIELPNEYFTKNPKALIHSHILGERNLKKKKALFGKFISEIYQKTGRTENLQNSIFLDETREKIMQLDSLEKRNKLKYINNIDLNQEIVFAWSFGNIDFSFKNKLLCSDFSLSNPNAPILSDFFYQILDSLSETKLSSQQELFSLILEKAEEFGILEFISELQLEIKLYFTLFVLNYCASNPSSKNFTLLELLRSSKNDYLTAC